MNRKFAVLITHYNRPDALLATLDSMRGEAIPFDVVLVDDGSPQKPVLPEFLFPVTLLVMEKNGGIAAALNMGLKYIFEQGYEYIARMDVGDFWVPGRLTAQGNFLDQYRDHAIVGCAGKIVTQSREFSFFYSQPETDADVRRQLPFDSAFFHPAVMLRASALRDAGFYSLHYPAAEDYEYFWRILRNHKGANLRDSWIDIEHALPGHSISHDRRRRQLISALRIQLKFFDILNWRCYAGVVRTCLKIMIPRMLIRAVKSILGRKDR